MTALSPKIPMTRKLNLLGVIILGAETNVCVPATEIVLPYRLTISPPQTLRSTNIVVRPIGETDGPASNASAGHCRQLSSSGLTVTAHSAIMNTTVKIARRALVLFVSVADRGFWALSYSCIQKSVPLACLVSLGPRDNDKVNTRWRCGNQGFRIFRKL